MKPIRILALSALILAYHMPHPAASGETGRGVEPLALNYNHLILAAWELTQHNPAIDLLYGKVSWIEDMPEDGLRQGVFITDEVMMSKVSGAGLAPGTRITFRVKQMVAALSFLPPADFDDGFNPDLPTGREYHCLVVSYRHSSGNVKRAAYHLPDISKSILDDIRRVPELLSAKPKPSELNQWRDRVSGPLGKAVLMRFMSHKEYDLYPPEVPEYALEALASGDVRLLFYASSVLSATPDEVLFQIPTEQFNAAFSTAAKATLECDDVGLSRLISYLRMLANHVQRLPDQRRRELAGILHGIVVAPVNERYAERHRQRLERLERARISREEMGIEDFPQSTRPEDLIEEDESWVDLRRDLEQMMQLPAANEASNKDEN